MTTSFSTVIVSLARATCVRDTCSMYLYCCSTSDLAARDTVVCAAYPIVIPVSMVRVSR